MSNVNIEIKKEVFNSVYLPYLDNTDRYLIFYGGAGSGKSVFVAQRYIYKILKEKNLNLLVVRAVANTNRDSTFALFKQVISNWNLDNFFKINESDLRIKCILNSNEILFKGLDNTEKLKSITFANGELTDIWIEEASETLEEDFNQLDVRLRGGDTKKQIVLSFNPIDVNHWIKRNLIDTKRATVLKTTYKNNKFLDKEYKELLESYKNTDEYYYNVYCLGNWGTYGKSVFNTAKINKRIQNIKEPIKTGSFIYGYNGLKITNIKFENDENGYIRIYKLPKKGYPYVLAGDTAGEGSDFFTAHVIDNTTGEQVAVLKRKFDEDEYARQIYCLARYYNNALVGLETNFSTYPQKELERLGYKKFYVREREDTYTDKVNKAYGFKTTAITRPIIIAELVKIVKENIEKINDKETLEEMLTFVRNAKGRAEAQNGAHDDLVMALAIVYYIREQQSFVIEKENNIENKFNFESERMQDCGEIGSEEIVI